MQDDGNGPVCLFIFPDILKDFNDIRIPLRQFLFDFST
jgi:hypothetical protein